MGIVDKTFSFNFETQEDIVSWSWSSKKIFTTKSVYNHTSSDGEINSFNHIWRSKLPYKIKIFTWLLEKGAILTKDNMLRRKWIGDPSSKFCDQPETIDHLFFQCSIAKCVWAMIGQCFGANNTPRDCRQYKQWIRKWLPDGHNVYHFNFAAVCWAIWKCRNKAVFDAKLIRHPAEILLHSYAFMNYWAGLYTSDFQGRLLDGVKTLLACAHKVLAQQAGGATRGVAAVVACRSRRSGGLMLQNSKKKKERNKFVRVNYVCCGVQWGCVCVMLKPSFVLAHALSSVASWPSPGNPGFWVCLCSLLA